VSGAASATLCVLSSSSRGNCSVLALEEGASRVAWLIDLGLSPRRTRTLLREAGLGDFAIAGALLTHLDHDHIHSGWIGCLPQGWRVMLHARHVHRAMSMGILSHEVTTYERDFVLMPGTHSGLSHGEVRVWPKLNAHDDLGSVAFRISLAVGEVGYATDIGRPTHELVDHLRGVDVLAIESNYCPQLQRESSRPDFLKQRIMGGKGHLSNEQSARLVRAMEPTSDVVLLHLSQQCNTPAIAMSHHQHRGVAVHVASPISPTALVRVRREARVDARAVENRIAATLWG
jgi:phosphoribosyl 1,2-cyclic phosphodiesterase